MAVQFVCECGKKISVNEEMVGKRVRCPACQRVITVPTDDGGGEGDDLPPSRPDREKKKKSSTMLYVGIGAGVLLLSCCCLGGVGVGLFFLLAQNDKVLAGSFPLEERGTWTSTDRHTTVSEGLFGSASVPYKGYKVPFKANTIYVIDLIRNDNRSDPYLVLQDANGKTVATNDDGGKGLDARIVYTAPTDGDYRILAATIKELGSFTLKIAEQKFKSLTVPAIEKGQWTAQDPLHDFTHAPVKIYVVNLVAGKNYKIDLVHGEKGQDPYLYLTDNKGKVLAQDDDGGGYPDARIIFMATQTAEYRILATSISNSRGNFTLSIREGLK